MGCASSKTTDDAAASVGREPVKATPVKATAKTDAAEGANEFREVSLSPKSGGAKKASASDGGSSTPLAKPKAAVDDKLVHEMSEAVTSVKATPAAAQATGVKTIPKPKPIANAEQGGAQLEKSKTQRKNERRRQREKQKKAEEKQANALRAISMQRNGPAVSVDRDLY